MIFVSMLIILSCFAKDDNISAERETSLLQMKKELSAESRTIHSGKPNKKIYCHSFRKTKYEVITTGNRIEITSIYQGTRNTVRGFVKAGKIYTDDPVEKAVKSQAGITYVIKGNLLRVKNLENGDYEEYHVCK